MITYLSFSTCPFTHYTTSHHQASAWLYHRYTYFNGSRINFILTQLSRTEKNTPLLFFSSILNKPKISERTTATCSSNKNSPSCVENNGIRNCFFFVYTTAFTHNYAGKTRNEEQPATRPSSSFFFYGIVSYIYDIVLLKDLTPLFFYVLFFATKTNHPTQTCWR